MSASWPQLPARRAQALHPFDKLTAGSGAATALQSLFMRLVLLIRPGAGAMKQPERIDTEELPYWRKL